MFAPITPVQAGCATAESPAESRPHLEPGRIVCTTDDQIMSHTDVVMLMASTKPSYPRERRRNHNMSMATCQIFERQLVGGRIEKS